VRWLGGADMIVSPVVVKTSVTTRSSPYLAGARRSSGFQQKKTQAQMGLSSAERNFEKWTA